MILAKWCAQHWLKKVLQEGSVDVGLAYRDQLASLGVFREVAPTLHSAPHLTTKAPPGLIIRALTHSIARVLLVSQASYLVEVQPLCYPADVG